MRGRPRLAHETFVVVPAQQGDENVRVSVEIIFCKSLCDLSQLFAFRESAAQGIEERKVQKRIEGGIYAVEADAPALKERSVDDIAVFDFADDAERWILALNCHSPSRPESVGHVLPGVFADAVETRDAYPP